MMEEVNLSNENNKKNNTNSTYQSKFDNYPASLFKQSKTPVPGVSFNETETDNAVLISSDTNSIDSNGNYADKRTKSSTQDMGRQGTYHPKKKENKGATAKISTLSNGPTIINDSKEKDYTKDKRKGYTGSAIACLLTFAILAALTSALITHFVTLEQCPVGYPNKTIVLDDRFGPDFFKNITIDQETEDEEENMSSSGEPTAEELRLPKSLRPIWYDLKLKVYLPGYVEIPKNKNLTFDSSIQINFVVDEETNEIVLNADKLKFDTNDLENKYKLFKSDPSQNTKNNINVDRKHIFRRSSNDTIEEFPTTTVKPISEEFIATELPLTPQESNTTLTNTNFTTSKSIDKTTTTIPVSSFEAIETDNDVDITTETSISKTTKKTFEDVTVAEEEMTPSGVNVIGVVVNETLKKVVFKLSSTLKKGETYIFAIKYSGKISNYLSGLYLTKYTSHKKTVLAAVTQMEPDDARQLAVCFDEPEFKAKWRVSVQHPKGTVAIGNGIELQNGIDTDDNDWKLTTFKETPPMSSYLLALVIGNFSYTEGNTKTGVRVRVWSRPETVAHTTYALEAGIKVLEFYEKYFDEPFPLEKQDLIGLTDFSAGAMENWGLITYRETDLLYDPKVQFPFQKIRVSLVIAHEMAHQVFGNQITLKFWDDLWIQEGFASFLEHLGSDAISDGKFRQDEYFISEVLQNAMKSDSKATSHPLFFPITKAEDISHAFDVITYDKGASFIRMLKNVIGEENFVEGIREYIERYKYSNAVHEDLWKALQAKIPSDLKSWDGKTFDVSDFSNKWVEQMGYPVVYVRRIDETSVELLQKRFKLDDNTIEDKKFRNAKYWYKWDVPIWYSINGEEKKMTWLHESTTINTTLQDTLIINTDSKGFYRVNYDKFGWESIIKQLNTDHTKISIKTRAKIIEDAFSLAEANLLPYYVPLNITNYLSKETEYIPWIIAITNLDSILSKFDDDPEVEIVEKYFEKLLKPLYSSTQWEELNSFMDNDVNIFENQLKSTVINMYCQVNRKDCAPKSLELFRNNFVKNCKDVDAVSSECSKVPPMIRKFVYCNGVKYGTEEDWQFVYDKLNNEISQIEQNRLLTALGCTRSSLIKKKMLNDSISIEKNVYRLQDVPLLLYSLASDPLGSRISFEYLIDNWNMIEKILKKSYSILSEFISGCIQIYRKADIDVFERFLEENKKTTHKYEDFKQRLEAAKQRKEWKEKHMEPLYDWFSKNI
ncbi:Peptidase M1, membrane alanine aminopeptidase, N-terminal domain and ERAP1-like C-terminal domain-containing protein [Strongyloides ratti]|uniref:Peptidase M1, membrane alanine aminopeptidase, N-terminal domain and ERAP1-like C-terminal domain-containing protein n=1 Tax=Strongyloides ratti TaxID=34506 RepID=A0A090MZS6_STRRB|nr:Peptidase M1, membrane alanine aminopeptidase, N-terminal domain and ERAP1-like C-terminal domain-containing protein [Strongyloides ratti]CEF69449.1 Peptidase M1, membrane alanine aminopeptidase, N-terminal domain and ERAP1-like C-terminal domain-containing protein [Strongyloides ratti]